MVFHHARHGGGTGHRRSARHRRGSALARHSHGRGGDQAIHLRGVQAHDDRRQGLEELAPHVDSLIVILKVNGLVTTATVRMPSERATSAMTGAASGARAAAHAGGDEHHVRAGKRLLQALALANRDRPRFLGPRARSEPARTELDLVARLVARQHLRVGIDGDELDALHALLDHVIDGVAARAAGLRSP